MPEIPDADEIKLDKETTGNDEGNKAEADRSTEEVLAGISALIAKMHKDRDDCDMMGRMVMGG